MSKTAYAYYPITPLDSAFSTWGHTIGWLVEGILEEEKLRSALHRLVTKWPVLAGRLEPHGKSHRIKVPLGDLEDGYQPFILTSAESDLPITHYVELPLPFISNNLPSSLFKSPLAPASPAVWFQKDGIPFTYWHLTHFRQAESEYTCFGLTFSHAVFDGMGIASVIHALEAETLGRPWAVPPPPSLPVHYENALQAALDAAEKEPGCTDAEYHYMENVNAWYTLSGALWYIWQSIWHKTENRIIIVPAQVCDRLVRETREAVAQEGKEDIRLSTGDVLAAWLLKTIYSAEPPSSRKITISNQMCMRKLLNLPNYPHNCFTPLPYPNLTISEIHSTPLPSLAHTLSLAKSSTTLAQVLTSQKHVKRMTDAQVRNGTKFFLIPADTRADETFLVTNVSNGRVVNVDWTGLGGGRTVFRYKTNVGRGQVPLSNYITIAGKREDGSIALDVILNQKRLKALVDGISGLSTL